MVPSKNATNQKAYVHVPYIKKSALSLLKNIPFFVLINNPYFRINGIHCTNSAPAS